MAETAVRWRNDAAHDEKLVIILNPVQEQQKVHSLHMLEPFTDDLFYAAICNQGISNATDPTVKKVWQSLLKKQTRQRLSLVAGQVIALYAELEAGTAVNTALATLNLLPDDELVATQDSFDDRFKQNKELITWLDELDKSGMRILARALVNDETDEISKTFGLIKQYRAKKSSENLADLSFQSVEQINKAPKPKDESNTNVFKPGSASQALVNDLLSLPNITDEAETDDLLSAFEAQAGRLSELFRNEVEAGEEEKITRKGSAKESVYVYPKKEDQHPLHDVVDEREWVDYHIWGGLLSIEEIYDAHTSLTNALQDEQFQQTFTPHPIDQSRDLLTEIDKIAQLPPDPAPQSHAAI